jgi:hypothetical protein
MNRAVMIVLASLMGCSACMTAARAGDADDHSPAHAARTAAGATGRQEGTQPIEKHKAKQGVTRKLSMGEKNAAKHADRSSRTERLKAKQSIGHVRQADRASRGGPKHQTQVASLANRKLKQGAKSGHSKIKKNHTEQKQKTRHVSAGKL